MTPAPFNVDNIVILLTEMYSLILRSQSLPEISIIHGPHSPPLFTASIWTDAGMDPETVYVLSRLPYFSSISEKIGPDMSPMTYLRDIRSWNSYGEEDEESGLPVHLDSWTDPFGLDLDDKTGYIEPWCIPLTQANHSGFVLILDCKTNEIFEVDWNSHRYDLPEAPQGSNEGYYRHYPFGPAPDVLKKWIGYYRSLIIVPDFLNGNWSFIDKDGESSKGDEGKETRQLFLDYKWPDSFRDHEFAVALEPWKEALEAKLYAEMEAEQAQSKKDAKDWVRRTYGENIE